MIKVRVYRKGEELTTVPVADLSEVRQDPEVLIWVDAVSPTEEELATMGEEFELHPLVLETLRTPNLRPKVEQFKDYVLMVCYTAERAPGRPHPEPREVDLVSGRNFLLSVHRGQPIDAEAIAERIRSHPELASEGGGFLLYVVLDDLVDAFFPALDAIGEHVEDLEESVFQGHAQVQEDLFLLRKKMVAVRRVAGPMRDAMVVLLRRDLGLFSDETRRYLQDIYDHLVRVVESVEDYQDLTANALDANLAVISNQVAEVARSLGAYAAIVAVLTVIAGIYGMNFHHMPELGWRYGYAWALGLMLVSGVGLWLFFKRKKWL
ncbi:MAG TPA: magnesium/cobalt transporter CorA [Actinomycetota bacterium]